MQNCSRRHSQMFVLYFSEEIRFDISYKLFARQMIHMKCQAIFSLEKKKKNTQKTTYLIMLSAALMIGSLRVK